MTHTDSNYGHSLMFLYDQAMGLACSALRGYIIPSQSAPAAYLLNHCLLPDNVRCTDWIHQSYRDLVTIPFADLAKAGNVDEIKKRVGGQYRDYYQLDSPSACIHHFHGFMGDFGDYRRGLEGETPEEEYKKLWKEACDAVSALNDRFKSLNTGLDQLGASIKETLTLVEDCKGDPSCLEKVAVPEWDSVMETAEQIDAPEK
ncbi:hypothetical protein ACPXCE_27900 [Streptomyces sp. DT24]|uniref:hypothetical protein n=1 Tax=Streptomyces sp. DT24 TaxID=3416520 RepID=UPI003CF59A75